MFNDCETYEADEYEPSEDELRKIDEMLRKEDEVKDKNIALHKNRLYFHFNSDDHWKGWLRTNGIRWDQ